MLRPTSSEREQHVLMLLAQRHTLTTIAQDLGLSVKTVQTYRARLMGKLNLTTTHQLMRYAVQSQADLPMPIPMQPIPRPVIAPAGMAPMLSAPVPIVYRSHSVEREEWPG